MWPHRQQPTRLPHPWDSPGKNTGVGCHFLLYANINQKKAGVAILISESFQNKENDQEQTFSSVQSVSCADSLRPFVAHQASLSITTPTACSNSCPSNRWCHPTISSSVVPSSFCLQSFPASGSFQMSQFFTSGGQSIGVSALASVLPMNIQDWFLLGLTDLMSLQPKGLSRVFSNTTVQNHQFFSIQLSL